MKMVRKIHFWIGIVAMVFLLIQSVTGLTLYFSKNEPQLGGQPSGMQKGWDPAGQGTEETETTDETAASDESVSQDGSQSVQGNGPGMEGGGQAGEGQRPGGMPGEDSTVKNIHD